MSELINQVKSIAESIENGITFEDCGMDWKMEERESSDIISGFDWLHDCLDIQYIISRDGECLGGRVLVSFGGPTIWVDTVRGVVEGHWWGEAKNATFEADAMDINDAILQCWESK